MNSHSTGRPHLIWQIGITLGSISLLIPALPAQGQLTTLIQQDPPPSIGARKIVKFLVTGNKVLNSDYIITASRHKIGDLCDTQILQEMRDALVNTGNFGFGDPESVRVSSQEDAEGCTIVIDVDENPKIERVEVTGSGPIPIKDIDKLITRTTVYNINQFRLDLDSIIDAYRKKGYTINIGSEVGPKLEDPTILTIPIIVDRVSEIKIAGTKKTKNRAILREMMTKEGGYFNADNLRKDQQKIFNLGIFEAVDPVVTPISVGKVALTLTLKERPTGQVSAGLGFSNRQQLVGFAQLTESNFRGMAESVNLRWETGGITGRNTIELGYVQPWLDSRNTSLGVQLYDRVFVRFANRLQNFTPVGNALGQDDRYFEQRTGGTITVGRPFRKTYRTDLALRIENVRSNPLALTVENSEILQNVQLLALTSSLVHDTRDLFLDPAAGSFQSVSIQVGTANIKPIDPTQLTGTGANVFGSSAFAKTQIDYRYYLSLGGKRKKIDEPKSVLALRTQVGLSSGRLPFSEQFFLGGPESLRGYREDRFWGDKSFLVSAELRQPLARSFTGVLFLDIGTAWGGSYQGVSILGFTQTDFKPRVGFGVGVRVRTPIAPIRIDYGIGDEGARTYVSFGNIF